MTHFEHIGYTWEDIWKELIVWIGNVMNFPKSNTHCIIREVRWKVRRTLLWCSWMQNSSNMFGSSAWRSLICTRFGRASVPDLIPKMHRVSSKRFSTKMEILCSWCLTRKRLKRASVLAWSLYRTNTKFTWTPWNKGSIFK